MCYSNVCVIWLWAEFSEIFPFDYLFFVLLMIKFVYLECAPQFNGFTFSLIIAADAAAAAIVVIVVIMMQYWDADFLNAFQKLIKLVSFFVSVGWFFLFFFFLRFISFFKLHLEIHFTIMYTIEAEIRQKKIYVCVYGWMFTEKSSISGSAI